MKLYYFVYVGILIIRRNGPASPSYLKLHSYSKSGVSQCISFLTIFCGHIPRKVKFRKTLVSLVSFGSMVFAVLVNLVLLASPPFWSVNWLSPKNSHVLVT